MLKAAPIVSGSQSALTASIGTNECVMRLSTMTILYGARRGGGLK